MPQKKSSPPKYCRLCVEVYINPNPKISIKSIPINEEIGILTIVEKLPL